MTKTENMMRIMRGERPQWTPVVALIDNFHFIYPLSDAAIPTGDYIAMQRHFGGDVIERGWNTAPPILRENNRCPRTSDERDGVITDQITTDRGVLTQMREYSEHRDFCFTRKHYVCSPEDYKTYLHVVETDNYRVDPADNSTTAAGMANLGDDGIAYVTAPCSPLMTIVREVTGIGRFLYDSIDYPELLSALMDAIHQRNLEQYEITAKHTVADIIVSWDDAETAQLSPRMFREHVVPTIRDYARICHKYGKLLSFHTCGAISHILDLFPAMEIDAVDWVQHRNIGDVTFDEVERAWGDSITILGSLSSDVFKTGSEATVRQSIEEIAAEVSPLGRFIFMMPPPQGTSEALMTFAMKTARECFGQ